MSATEPLSALRRLHEEATRDCRGTDELIAKQRARRAARNALPALADLAEAGAEMAALMREYAPTLSVRACRILDGWDVALAALRERLEAKP